MLLRFRYLTISFGSNQLLAVDDGINSTVLFCHVSITFIEKQIGYTFLFSFLDILKRFNNNDDNKNKENESMSNENNNNNSTK